MMSLRRLAVCLALSACAACGGRWGAGAERAAEPGTLAALLDLPPERRGAAIDAFIRAARLRVRVEVVPREPLEAKFGALLPIGLDDFDIVRVLVEQDEPGVVVDPAVAIVPTVSQGAEALPMFSPTRELFLAFTGERHANQHTRYRLKATGLPWIVNVLTVGVLEIASVESESEVVQPTEEEHARAAPRATRLAELVSPEHGCANGRSPCDRYLIVPKQRDDVPLRLDIEIEMGDVRISTLRLSWSAALPAGGPLAARLDGVFHGAAIGLEGARIEPTYAGQGMAGGCRLRDLWCLSPTSAHTARPQEPPPVAPPARLATPEQSLAARPQWSPGPGYAPHTRIGAVAPDQLVTAGPLRDALLVCDLEVQGEKDPRSLVVEARAGKLPVHDPKVYRHDGHPRFLVPLVHLDPGDALAVSVSRRSSSWFSGAQDVLLGEASLVHNGALPLVHSAGDMTVSCAALGRDGVEKLVAERLEALAKELASFDIGVDPIVEGSPDWGISGWGMRDLQRGVEAIAGLVGWSDPRIRALLPALEHYRGVFQRHLGRSLAARREQLPAPGTLLSFEAGDLRVIGSACGAAIDRRRVLWAHTKVPKDGCVTIVEVIGRAAPLTTSPRTGSFGSVWSPELAWEDGRRTEAWGVGVESPTSMKRRDPAHLVLAPGESARFYLASEQPFHREGQDGPLFLIARDGNKPVFIRLR